MSAALSKTEQALEKAKGAVARVREMANARAKKIKRVATGIIAAYAVGAYEHSRITDAAGATVVMPTLFHMDHLLVYGLALALGGELVGGDAGEVMEDAGVGILCAYGHKKGVSGAGPG